MPNIKAVSVASRVSCIRQFSLYLLANGYESYLPRYVFQGHPHLIHVLNDDELHALFYEIDCYSPNGTVFQRLALEYKVMFRILICCGMRVSEVRKLKKSDVDFNHGIITIKASKGQKDRLVYLPEDLRNLCVEYQNTMKILYGDDSVWLFPAREPDNLMTVGVIDKRFNFAWNNTVYANQCKTKPTVHSLRHTFVVKRMNQWMLEGVSLNSMLPYLSKYLGHSSVDDTFYYYHQVEEAFQVVRNLDTRSHKIIPEVMEL